VGSGLYFDYCATTPLDPSVREAMLPALGDVYGNPSSMHMVGQQAREWVELARNQVAVGLGAASEGIIFTSGATEANNLALIGVMHAAAPEKDHLIVSAIEHHAVLHTAEALAAQGFEVTYLPVDPFGFVAQQDLENAIRPETALVSIMMVNNEVGSVQRIREFGALTKKRGVIFHTDAVQALNCFKIDVDQLNVDLLSLSAHKIYGPKGVGALYIRDGVEISPILFGGAQERAIRPGTENVPGIVGLGAAMELRNETHSSRYEKFSALRQELVNGLEDAFPGVIFNGAEDDAAPHIVSVSFPDVDGELLLFRLSQKKVAVSMGSACTSESIEPSHVLAAMSIPDERIESTLRISIGDPTTSEEVQTLINILPEIIEQSKMIK
jgi:cysteine desulfurase